MKKTRKALLSMILSAAMVIAMLPGMSMVAKAEEPQDDSQVYSIETDLCKVDIENMDEVPVDTVPVDTVVTITALAPGPDASFDHWEIKKKEGNTVTDEVTDALLGNDDDKKKTSTTTFSMPAYNIHVLAVFAFNDPGSGGDPEAGSGTSITYSDEGWTGINDSSILDAPFTIYNNSSDNLHFEVENNPGVNRTIEREQSLTMIEGAGRYTVVTLQPGNLVLHKVGEGSGGGPGQTEQAYTLGVAASCTATIGSDTVSGNEVSVPAKTSITITVADMSSDSNRRFDYWEITEDSATGTDITSTILSGDAAKNSTITFSMPAKNIYVTPSFATGSGSGNDNTDAQQEGSNDSILFRVGSNGFDIQGKDGNKNIRTTYSDSGYVTRMQVGSNSMDFTGFAYGKKYSFEGIEGDVTASLNGNSVAIVYTLKNTTNETKSVKIGSYADTKVGEDDDAPVSFTNKGIQMISKDGKYAFVVNPVGGDFTTRWYGSCGEVDNSVFNNRTDSETFTSDSGVAWSWSVEVPANSTVTRTVLLAAGSAESIIEPQSDTNSSKAEINITGETAVKDETPVVPGLDAEATSEGEDVSLNLQIAVEPEATLEASPTLNSEPDIKEKVKNQFKDESTVKVDVLNINLRKLVEGIFTEYVTSTNSVLEIGIGYDFAGKYDPSLVSKHGDDVRTFATLTARPSAGNYRNGTFFPDVANGKFYIYSSDFSEFVISYSTVEGNAQNRSVIDPNASAGSSSASVATNTAPKATPVYRLFNLQKGYHFFTTNLAEKEALVAAGWTDEGVAWYTPANAGKPVYRLFDKTKGGHIFTTDAAQKDACIAAGSTFEGIAWYGLDTGRTVYKITNPKLGRGLYTVNPAEKDALAALGFTVEEADFKVN